MTDDGIVTIEPIRAEHVESFHRALDTVSRERKYLTFLEAPPLEAMRAFVQDMIEKKLSAIRSDCGWRGCRLVRHPP